MRRFAFAFRPGSYELVLSTCTHRVFLFGQDAPPFRGNVSFDNV